MKFKKRGAIEVQFNWIFILIVGGIILLFFGVIISKQRASSEQKLSASLLSDLESIIASSSVTKEGLNFIPIPKKDINFEKCDFYYIGKKKESNVKLKKDIKEKIIFTPNLIKGTKLTIWTLPWNIPYRVTNFVYLTSPQIRYIFVANDFDPGTFAYEVEQLLPPETITSDEEEFTVMNRQKTVSTGSFTDLNNYKVKFVFLDVSHSGDLSAFSDMEDEDVRAIEIERSTGKITFYKKSGSSFVEDGSSLSEYTSYYYGDAALIAAIFAEDMEMYECAMQNAFQRMRVVSEVYYERTDNLIDGSCLYTESLTKLGDIKLASGTVNQVITKIENNQLPDQDKNCPLVY